MDSAIAALLALFGQAGKPFSLVGFFGQFHPLIVHFPVALTVVAALAEALFLAFHRSTFAVSGRFLSILAAPAAVTAATLGVMHKVSLDFSPDLVPIVLRHQVLALTTTGLLIAALVASELGRRGRPRLLPVYRALIFAAAATVGTTGFFGGELVYGPGHYFWPWSH